MADQAFVARERELAQLNSFLDEALAGHGQVVFVTGEAGAGKTALVTEFARRAQTEHDDLLVAVGDCNSQTGIGDPYLPFRQVLEMLTGNVEADAERGAVSPENATRLRHFLRVSGQALVELGPDLIDILVPGAGLATRAGAFLAGRVGWVDRLEVLAEERSTRDGGQALEQHHIFEQYTDVLSALADKQPLVLMLDDLQWADQASIGLLFHLARSCGQSRILIVGTYRPADVALGRQGQRHPVEPMLNEVKRYFGDVWIELSAALETEGRAFVDAWLDTTPNRLDEAFREALHRHTRGHPLFTIELLRDLKERGVVVRAEDGYWVATPALDWDTLPARVEGVIVERIGRLPGELRETLTVAAVEGEDFTAEVVAAVRAADSRAIVRQLSGELEKRHHLVGAQGFRRLGRQRLSRYRFNHTLFHAYLYGSLDEIERAYLHEDVARALEELYAGQTGEGPGTAALAPIAGELAWHFEAAGLAEEAIEYLYLAGERARALYAPNEAVAHFTHALELADDLPSPPPLSLYRARGQAYETLGEFENAHADHTAALEAAGALGDDQAAWQALVDLGLLWAARDYAQTGAYYEQALERARRVGDAATLAHSLNRVGNWHVNTEQPGEALHYHEEALAIFQQLDDQPGIAETLDLLGMASGIGGDLVRCAAYCEQAVTRFTELDDRPSLVSSLGALAFTGSGYHTATLVPAALSRADCVGSAERALEIVRTIDWPAGEANTLWLLGFVLGAGGDYAPALKYAREGLEIATEIAHRQWMTAGYCALGALHHDLFDLRAARQYLEKASTLAKDLGSWYWIRAATGQLASTYIARDEPGLAATALGDALEADTPFRTVGQRLSWCARGELALAVGDPARALEIADQLIATAVNLTPGSVIPRLWHLRGQALRELDRTAEAEAVWQAARQAAHAMGLRPMEWRIHAALGSLYSATSRPEAAEREFRAAQSIIQELAANIPDVALRENFLRSAGAMVG